METKENNAYPNAIPLEWIEAYSRQFPEDMFPFKKMIDTWKEQHEDFYSSTDI